MRSKPLSGAGLGVGFAVGGVEAVDAGEAGLGFGVVRGGGVERLVAVLEGDSHVYGRGEGHLVAVVVFAIGAGGLCVAAFVVAGLFEADGEIGELGVVD